MDSRLFLLSAVVFASSLPATAFAASDPEASYTLQVGAFPSTDLADKFVVKLVQAGEKPGCTTVELQGRGYWTRVFVGLFPTSNAARRYGDNLIARGIVSDFLVKRPEPEQSIVRPRRVTAAITAEPKAPRKAAVFYIAGDPSPFGPLNADSRQPGEEIRLIHPECSRPNRGQR